MIYDKGDIAKLTMRVRTGDDLVDPAEIQLSTRAPDGTIAEYMFPDDAEITRESEGVYIGQFALDQEGYWIYRWETEGTGEGAEEGFLEVRVSALVDVLPVMLRPGLDDVGALMRARTAVMGRELGTFTAETRPTGDQVQTLLSQAVAEVSARIGATIPERLWPAARALVALRTAMLIEASYFPESSESGYSRFRELYEDAIGDLTAGLEGDEPGSTSQLASIPITTLVAQSSPYLGIDELLP